MRDPTRGKIPPTAWSLGHSNSSTTIRWRFKAVIQGNSGHSIVSNLDNAEIVCCVIILLKHILYSTLSSNAIMIYINIVKCLIPIMSLNATRNSWCVLILMITFMIMTVYDMNISHDNDYYSFSSLFVMFFLRLFCLKIQSIGGEMERLVRTLLKTRRCN